MTSLKWLKQLKSCNFTINKASVRIRYSLSDENHVRNVSAKLLSQVTKNVIIAYQMSFFDLKVFDQNVKVYGAQNLYGAHNF